MLHITENVKTLREETVQMTKFANSIVSKLNLVNSDSNLTKEIGIFVKQIPDFKVLKQDADSLVEALRMVCTGEIDPHYTAGEICKAVAELRILTNALENIE